MEALVASEPEADDERVDRAIEEWRRSYQMARHSSFLDGIGGDDGSGDPARVQGGPDLSRWEDLIDQCFTAWGRLLRDELTPTSRSELLPALVGPLEDRDLRDALIGWLCPGWLPLDVVDDRLLRRLEVLVGDVDEAAEDIRCDRRRVQDVLDGLCRVTPNRFAAPVLTVTASYAWSRGDGAKAGMCVDRALEVDPDHRLARLIRLGLDHGLRLPAA
jgi:hypothetical protein